MRICDWSSDVCSSDLSRPYRAPMHGERLMNSRFVLPLVLAVGIASLCACHPPKEDPYDISRMDLKPVPAQVTAERHTGAYAAGAALSFDAILKPLEIGRASCRERGWQNG